MRRATLWGVLVALVSCGWWASRPALAEIVCADDLVPEGMAVTATGTSPTCAGSCRAREMNPVCGPVVKICAGQPIPKGYLLDSVTTTPGCSCLGIEDNAYVIRYAGMQDGRFLADEPDPYLSEEPEPSPNEQYREEEDSNSPAYLGNQGAANLPKTQPNPYGDPPFGNVLCVETPTQPQPYGGQNQSAPAQARDWSSPANAYQLPGNGAGSPPSWNAAPPPSWDPNDEQSEPFRVGQ
jgi:hypothetical protein